jgi:hypothetical protein
MAKQHEGVWRQSRCMHTESSECTQVKLRDLGAWHASRLPTRMCHTRIHFSKDPRAERRTPLSMEDMKLNCSCNDTSADIAVKVPDGTVVIRFLDKSHFSAACRSHNLTQHQKDTRERNLKLQYILRACGEYDYLLRRARVLRRYSGHVVPMHQSGYVT